ncbi:peptide ABC transporter substrate-binding protein [Dictyobacter aurantiacus]|uniref:ABC transporter substrate-binding protein n=1 Tax=Dictyobacter aurantiacus TaxID=1936993 RepID=A0A401ZHY6_9CHLR|nr:peptide ABC transporter substrate-binding protein [Dictyobacter aurantiacus]GCE06459.1 ABC transporter substrate-binding protein [Dictyobacter aurantiacus]
MRSTKKSALGIIATMLVLMATVLSACGGGGGSTTTTNNSGKAPADKQVFNWPLAGIADIKTFDPAMATTQTSLQAIGMVFTGLVTLDNDQKVVPELAQSWTSSDGGLTWTFKLKPNLKFSDGTPLTSADVAYSINRALLPDLNSPASPSYLNLIKDSDKMLAGKVKTIIGDSLLTPDPNTIVIKITEPAGYFLATLTYSTAYVVEKKLIDKYGNKNFTDHLTEGGGSGPFKVQEYTHGKRIVFVPNSNYVNGVPSIKVVSTFYKDAATTYQAYKNGQVDQASVPTDYLNEQQNSKEYHKVPILAIFYYGLNFLTKPFDNLKIRQAFELALNKDEMIKVVYKGVYTPTNHIVPSGMPGYNPDLKGPDGTTSTAGNPTLAKQLFTQGLKEDGYANAAAVPAIKFQYASGSADTDKEIAVAAQQWKDVLGVTVKPIPTDFETLSASLPQNVGKTTIQMFESGWGADYPDPQDFLTLQFAAGSPNNQTNWGQNKVSDAAAQVQVQKALNAADTEQDNTKRMQAYNQAEQTLVNDVAWLPIFQMARSRVLKSYVVGRVFNAGDSTPPFAWAKVYIANH